MAVQREPVIPSKKRFGRKLLWRAQNGDMSSFEALVERYRDDLYGFALRMTRSETEALEILKECFLSAYGHLNEFSTEAEFCAWIHWIVAHHALNRVPPLQSPESVLDGAEAQYIAMDSPDDADERTMSPELQRAIEETTEGLLRRQREVLLLKDFGGLGYEQIARITGEPVPNIKTHLHQARMTLCDRIALFGAKSANGVQ